MEKIQIIILGRNYTSLLNMIRSVGNSNTEITIIKSITKQRAKKNLKSIINAITLGKPIEATSKYVNKYLYTIEPNREDLIEKILSIPKNYENKIIILPTDDYTASTIDMYREKLEKDFIIPTVNSNEYSITDIMDKGIQKAMAKKVGLKVADCYEINVENDKINIPKKIKFPVFTKPQISFKGSKLMMKKCENMEQLDKISEIAKKNKCNILAEEFIDFQKEYGVLGCSYNGEVIIPGIITKLSTGSGSHKGVTMTGKVESILKYKELYDKLLKFITSINFNGLFDIDLYEKDGEIYFNELNLRFGAGGYAITLAGVNLPKIYLDKILNTNEKTNQTIKEITFISDKVNLEDYINGYMTWNEYKEKYNKVDKRFLKSEEDIKPYKTFKKMETYAHFKNILKKILKKKVNK